MEKPLHEKICLSWFEADWLFYSQKQGWMHMLVFALLFEHHAIPAPCYPCAKVPEGVQHFPGGGGGVQLFPGGSNCLYPIETHVFQGGPIAYTL